MAIEKKIKKLRKKIKKFIKKDSKSIEDVHDIRTSSREILSLLNDKKLHSSEIKNILKLSNKIRDIDVLVTQYLPKVNKKSIDIKTIKKHLKKKRKKKLKKFSKYLKEFDKLKIKFESIDKNYKSKQKPTFRYEKKYLHKYRISIKNKLYLAKNSKNVQDDYKELLKQIKDLLGFINDNHNALKIISKLSIDKDSIKSVEQFTLAQNLAYFKELKTFVVQL